MPTLRGKLLQELLRHRILLLDGATGTELAKKGLDASDYGGPEKVGCHEALLLYRPDVVLDLHRSYLAAGADIVETNSFGATRVVLSEYGLADRAQELNRIAASLARQACAEFEVRDGRPRFVAGSMGPTTKSLTLTGGVDFDKLVAAYAERDVAWAERRAAALPGGRGRWLDVAAARDVAFHLRLREIAGQATSQATTTLVREARARGETWVTTVEGETTFAGQRTYRRVDLHTRAGIALYGYTHLDWERGEQCWLEVLRVDPETGAPVPGSRPVIQRRYRDRAALARAFARARRRYAGG